MSSAAAVAEATGISSVWRGDDIPAAAGPSSAASSAAPLAPYAATAAAAVAGASAGSVFVKRAGDARARFAPVEIFVGDAVGHLAKRASLERGWGVDAAYVDLFVVSARSAKAVEGGDESVGVAAKRLFSGDKLSAIGIVDGAFLLARLPSLQAAAPGECARARLAASFCRARAGGARRSRGRFRWGLCGALTLSIIDSFPSILRRRRRRRRPRRGCSSWRWR